MFKSFELLPTKSSKNVCVIFKSTGSPS